MGLPMTGSNGRSRGPFGPMEQLDASQREILDAALRVTAELTALTGDLATGGNRRSTGAVAPTPLDIGAVRSTMSKSLDMVVEVVHALVDSGLDALEQFGSAPRIDATGTAGATITIRPPGLDAEPGLLVTVLTRSDGRRVDLTTTSSDIDDAGAMSLIIPDDTPPGIYHGLVLDPSETGAALPLRLTVTPSDAR